MAGRLKKVAGGDRLEIPAAAYNAFIDAAEAHIASQSSQEGDSGVRRDLRNDLILVKNSSGENRGQSEILGIQSPLVLPTKNLNEFQNRLGVIGVVPAIGAHVGKFVVLAEPIPKDGIGYGWITGLAQVKVEVVSGGDTSAEIVGGRTTSLKGGAGTIPIVWKETGTGIKWAIVRLGGGGGGGGIRPARVLSVGISTINVQLYKRSGTAWIIDGASKNVFLWGDQAGSDFVTLIGDMIPLIVLDGEEYAMQYFWMYAQTPNAAIPRGDCAL